MQAQHSVCWNRRYTPESWSVEMASLLAFAPGTPLSYPPALLLDRANFTGLVLGCIEAKFCE